MSHGDHSIVRRLLTILTIDVVGYSRLMADDETGTLASLKALRKDFVEPEIRRHHGRVIKLMGDGALVDFPSVVEAVECALRIQEGMAERNRGLPGERQVMFRIGINLGDVIVDGDDIYGDGVNVAARLEKEAEPGGICISRPVRDQVAGRMRAEIEDLGEISLKNIGAVECFSVRPADGTGRQVRKAGGRWKPRLQPLRMGAGALVLLVAVAALAAWQGGGLSPPDRDAKPLQAPSQAGLAVLPFENMSGDPSQDYFSDGITADLINELSRISGVMVIARSTMFTYKGAGVSAREVGEDLGVPFILEGSVRRVADQVRVNAQLVETASNRQVWSDRYDREMSDIFALQDEITGEIVSALSVRLTSEEQERLETAADANPEAYDLLLQGLERYRRYTQPTNLEARALFSRAVTLDPDFARAHAGMALTYYIDALYNWTQPDVAIEQAYRWALSALALDDGLPQVYFALCDVYRFQKRFDRAIDAAEKAVSLDPNYADGYAVLGLTLIYAGEIRRGLDAMQRAMELNPRPPFFYHYNVGLAHYLMGNYEEAAEAAEGVLSSNPHFLSGHLLLAAAYGQLGRRDDAEWEIVEVMTLSPALSLGRERSNAQFQESADLEHYLEGLRIAGLPE